MSRRSLVEAGQKQKPGSCDSSCDREPVQRCVFSRDQHCPRGCRHKAHRPCCCPRRLDRYRSSTVWCSADHLRVMCILLVANNVNLFQELRVLKNFSSLKAIISGLQSNPVYRLERTWAAVPRDKVELFEELARIFSEDNNQWAQRELLIREGTAKFADTVGQNDKQLQKVFQKQLNNSGVSQTLAGLSATMYYYLCYCIVTYVIELSNYIVMFVLSTSATVLFLIWAPSWRT